MENLVIPKSIAIILDGNGRWAKKRNLPRAMGHKAGCETLEKTVEDCVRLGVECLTVYAFSTENWKRSAIEVGALMKLLRFYMVKLIDVANRNNVKAVMIGDESRFEPDIRKGIRKLTEATKNNTGMVFAFAINYGGRDEIKRAVENIVDDVESGKLSKENISEELISSYLDTNDLPDPDLLIRTSGELRVSNFLLWQIAYSEFYITDTLWPDFDKEELLKAIESYSHRQRRFGGR
ncbi:di-trans,poly-cis-decaprenylcistransferase [Lachnoanaerobaculum saburreum F0468]|jgi:di-trans,poly-cis-decaprenylcistransferase|uniref:Isoprenyl transferase n=1 Tax=Lachnoanaerobaculum saburreum F0468 TaxID=1095750 RepID=I0RBL3_9FIRM|nr:isoprenyl transferase [Lachnoanaerobaculum saburreum]EIC97071.1 di-trans,poly-cis-decaprenylcistransferase [Lachnoanaerobaculum saburreum F0468]RKW53320.1 MAG: isoprenyl transferase [Lachnospiraceae bacterium]